MRSKKTSVEELSDAGNSLIASQLIAYKESNMIIAGHARFRDCA